MQKRTAYYVTFLSPGLMFANDWSQPVDSPDPRKVKWPDNAYAFSMFEREDVIDGETVYQGKPQQVGPIYYHPASKVETLAEVRENPKATPILINNMRINCWAQVIWTRWGNWPQHFDAETMEILR